MHLHMHLKQILLGFGSSHASWCFSFERFNGILGPYPTNNRAIEPQIMKKFCHNQAIHSWGISLPNTVLPEAFQQTINSNTQSNHITLMNFSKCALESIKSFAFSKDMGIELLGPFYSSVFNSDIGEQVEN